MPDGGGIVVGGGAASRWWPVRGMEVIDKILAGRDVDANLALLDDLCSTLRLGSLCALGGFVPYPVLSAVRHFSQDFRRP